MNPAQQHLHEETANFPLHQPHFSIMNYGQPKNSKEFINGPRYCYFLFQTQLIKSQLVTSLCFNRWLSLIISVMIIDVSNCNNSNYYSNSNNIYNNIKFTS